MNKKAFIGKLFFIIIILIALFLLFNKLSRASSAVDIINITIKVNLSDIIVNVSNSVYTINNTNLTAFIQQNFTVFFAENTTINQTIITTNITCQNSTIKVDCGCTTIAACPNVNCSISEGVDLTNATKELFFNHYQTQLQSKIEESSNKVAQDVIFKLEPSKIELEACKQSAFNSSINEQEAYRQRDQQLEVNKRLAGLLGDANSQKRWLEVIGLTLVVVFVLGLLYFFGFFERFGGLVGGGYI